MKYVTTLLIFGIHIITEIKERLEASPVSHVLEETMEQLRKIILEKALRSKYGNTELWKALFWFLL